MRHLCLLFLGLLFCSFSALVYAETAHRDHQPGIYYTIVDSATGLILLETGLHIEIGDQLITDDNRFYQITRISKYTAYADYLRDESYAIKQLTVPVANNSAQGKLIAVYHSHTDESFIPTDGKSTIRGNGTIMKVGAAFAEQLLSLGYTVNHDKTPHDPHDANAYIRSRRTAARLLGEQPAALFDIHRDSAPVSSYRLKLNNELLSKIVIVVGRANPYMPTTLNYAKQLKAATDAQYPKLIRGIYFASGHYNQDINPRNILLEIGTEGSTLSEAQKSAVLFAGIIPSVLGGAQDATSGIGSTAEASPPGEGRPAMFDIESTAWWNILLLISLVSAGGLAYLYISTGSWQGVRKKLSQFRNLEFTNLFGLRIKRKNNDQNNSDEE